MPIDIKSSFAFELERTTDVLLQFEAAMIPEQTISDVKTTMSDAEHIARVPAQDAVGERIWVRAKGRFEVEYKATAQINRLVPDIAPLKRLAPHDMPGEAVQYLFDSRYCMADKFQSFMQDEFGTTDGGERVLAIRDWIADNFQYTPGASTATTTALDTFVERRGICRDYAHVMITLARASTIPARYVSCYAPGVTPQDFHAVAEVFLQDDTIEGGGAWHIVDATKMADPAKTAKIGIGRDAADVSFLTSFGANSFQYSNVEVLHRD